MPGPGVFGPYPRGKLWRVGVRSASDGPLVYSSFPTRTLADQYAAIAREELTTSSRTLDELIDLYRAAMLDKGNKPATADGTAWRMRRFFAGQLDKTLEEITPSTCARLYAALCAEGLAADTHRNWLNQAKSFLKWTVRKKWATRNPLEEVEAQGRRRKGKAQLRIDEARAWAAAALRAAAQGDEGAIAALCALLLGMRASEIVGLKVRDLDDGGRLLWIDDAKTEAGRRTLKVPEMVRPYLAALTAGRPATDPLFPGRTRFWVRDQVRALCAKAGTAIVSAHGMRGLHATLAVKAGATSDAVIGQLGHDSFNVTREHYIARGTIEGMQRDRVLEMVQDTPPAGFPMGFPALSAKGENTWVREAGLEPARVTSLDPKYSAQEQRSPEKGFRPVGDAETQPDQIAPILAAALDGWVNNPDPATLRAQLADALDLLAPQHTRRTA